MTTLQPKTPFFYSFCFWFVLKCHVYCCCDFFLSFIFFGETKTVYRTTCYRKCARKPSWLHWKREASGAQGHEKINMFHRNMEGQKRTPPPTFTPLRGNRVCLCLPTRQRRRAGKPKVRHLGLKVENGSFFQFPSYSTTQKRRQQQIFEPLLSPRAGYIWSTWLARSFCCPTCTAHLIHFASKALPPVFIGAIVFSS